MDVQSLGFSYDEAALRQPANSASNGLAGRIGAGRKSRLRGQRKYHPITRSRRIRLRQTKQLKVDALFGPQGTEVENSIVTCSNYICQSPQEGKSNVLVGGRKPSEFVCGQDRHSTGRLRGNRGGSRLAVNRREFAEKISGPKQRIGDEAPGNGQIQYASIAGYKEVHILGGLPSLDNSFAGTVAAPPTGVFNLPKRIRRHAGEQSN